MSTIQGVKSGAAIMIVEISECIDSLSANSLEQ